MLLSLYSISFCLIVVNLFIILFFVFLFFLIFFFFFSSRRRHTRSLCDWSSDVCSSDLLTHGIVGEYGFRSFGRFTLHASSSHAPGKNEPTTVSSPSWSARSLTSLPTARSSTPSPNGLNTETVSEPFFAGARPLRMSAKVHRMKSL